MSTHGARVIERVIDASQATYLTNQIVVPSVVISTYC